MSGAIDAESRNSLYDRDFFAWTQEQARLLRERRFDDLDLENLIDEVESVGGSDKRELESRIEVLIAHLLKWKYQPGARSGSWSGAINEQRRRLLRILRDSPSLHRHPQDVFAETYLSGRLAAARETGIDFTIFPEVPPFSLEEVLDVDYLPTEPDRLAGR